MKDNEKLNTNDLDKVSGGNGTDGTEEENKFDPSAVVYCGYRIDSSYCTYCGICADACPTGAIDGIGGSYSINTGLCTNCGVCAGECPSGAIMET